MISCFALATAGDFKSHWTRLNYGVTAVKTRTVCFIDGYETHTVEIKLPTPIQLNFKQDNVTTPTTCDALCTRLRLIANMTRALTATMQYSITHLLNRVHDLIPDFSEAPIGQKRQTRALFSLGGRIAHYL
jgi:hypothetical protein